MSDSIINSNSQLSHNYDDLLDEMEKGQLNNHIFDDYNYLLDSQDNYVNQYNYNIHDKYNKSYFSSIKNNPSFNRKIVNTSKRLFGIKRNLSDLSLDMKSETSNESTEVSPFLVDEDDLVEECFNWQLPGHNYESKVDDSNLSDFYSDFKTNIESNHILLSESPPKYNFLESNNTKTVSSKKEKVNNNNLALP